MGNQPDPGQNPAGPPPPDPGQPCAEPPKPNVMMRFVVALNTVNTPWVAIIVIILGMTFDLACQKFGVSNDAATGVIGAGIGLLTGQALRNGDASHETHQ